MKLPRRRSDSDRIAPRGRNEGSSIMPHCTIHTKTKLICPACIAARAGTSPRKVRSSRRNGRAGGRPPNHSPECDVQVTGRFTKNCPRCDYDAKRKRAA
jgi:hypothetical protein